MLQQTCVRYLFNTMILILLDIESEEGFLGHMVVLFLIFFCRAYVLFSIVAAPIYTVTNSV